mgnify:FL=1
MLVDSHCHLDYLERDGDLDEAVVRAREAGVSTIVTICTKVSEFETIKRIAERYDDIWCTVGIHPHEAATEPQVSTAQLLEIAQHPKVVGIGETGLDYYYEHSPREAQKISFRKHIAAARESGLPLIVHTRDADDDTMGILNEAYADGVFPGLIHCYSTSPKVAERAIEIGFYISIAGIVTFKRAAELQQTAAGLPEDRLLVETDAPYLAPVPKRGKRNEPSYVAFTAAKLAELRNDDASRIAAVTTDNFFRLFTKADRPA